MDSGAGSLRPLLWTQLRMVYVPGGSWIQFRIGIEALRYGDKTANAFPVLDTYGTWITRAIDAFQEPRLRF